MPFNCSSGNWLTLLEVTKFRVSNIQNTVQSQFWLARKNRLELPTIYNLHSSLEKIPNLSINLIEIISVSLLAKDSCVKTKALKDPNQVHHNDVFFISERWQQSIVRQQRVQPAQKKKRKLRPQHDSPSTRSIKQAGKNVKSLQRKKNEKLRKRSPSFSVSEIFTSKPSTHLILFMPFPLNLLYRQIFNRNEFLTNERKLGRSIIYVFVDCSFSCLCFISGVICNLGS